MRQKKKKKKKTHRGLWEAIGSRSPAQFNNPQPTDEPRAVIPVEDPGTDLPRLRRRRRHLGLMCLRAGDRNRLAAKGSRFRHVLFAAPNAGHRLGSLAPNAPVPFAFPATLGTRGRGPRRGRG